MARNLGTLTIDLVAKIGGFEQGLDKASRAAQKRSKEINAAIDTIGKNAATAAVASITAITGTLIVLGKQAIDTADQINDLSKITGVSTETLSRLGYAAQQSGSDMESLAAALPKFAKNITEAAAGTKAQAEAFDAIGVSVTGVDGKIKSIDELLLEVSDKFATYEDGAAKAALAQEFFGKSGAALIPFLNNGSEAISQLAQESDNLGNTISGNTAAAADEFNDNMARLKTLATGLANVLVAEVLPTLNALTGELDGSTDQTNLLKSAVQEILFPFRALAQEVILTTDFFKSFGTAAGAAWEALSRALVNDFAGAAQAIRDGNEAIEQSANDAAHRVEVLWGRAGDNIREKSAADLAAMGIQWQGLAATVIDSSKKIQGVGTVLLPGVTSLDRPAAPRTQAPVIRSGSGKTAKQGLTEEQKAAESLQRAYDSLSDRMREQIALFSEQTNAAQIRYATEQGDLAKLTDAQKSALIEQARALDELEQAREAQDFLGQQAAELDSIRSRYATENEIIQQSFNDRAAIIDKFRAIQLDQAGSDAEARLAIEAEFNELSAQNDLERFNQQQELRDQNLGAIGDTFGSMGQLAAQFAGEQSGIAQGLFAVQKAFAIAQSIVAIQTGLANAAALPFPANLGAMASVAAATASIVSTIQGTEPSFDGGGFTGFGPRSGGVDGKGGFMAVMHPNETVIDHTKGQTFGGGSKVVNQYISTPDANSFRKSGRQIARDAKRGLATA